MNPLEAYNILLQRHMSEDRVVGERNSMFLLATSFLFLAFVTLLNPNWTATVFKVLRILLPIVGLALTFLLYCLNRLAVNAMNFWHVAQRKIEEEEKGSKSAFFYMWDKRIIPHYHGSECIKGEREFRRGKDGKLALEPLGKLRSWVKRPVLSWSHIYEVYIPLIFSALWLVALVVAIVYTTPSPASPPA